MKRFLSFIIHVFFPSTRRSTLALLPVVLLLSGCRSHKVTVVESESAASVSEVNTGSRQLSFDEFIKYSRLFEADSIVFDFSTGLNTSNNFPGYNDWNWYQDEDSSRYNSFSSNAASSLHSSLHIPSSNGSSLSEIADGRGQLSSVKIYGVSVSDSTAASVKAAESSESASELSASQMSSYHDESVKKSESLPFWLYAVILAALLTASIFLFRFIRR